MSKTVDLSMLPGWLALSVGSHTVTVIAKADGYRDSDASTGVTVEKNGSILLLGTNCTLQAKAIRNGSEVTLAHGDAIYLGDEIEWSATAAAGYHMAEGNASGTVVADSAAFGGTATIKIEKVAVSNPYTVSGSLEHLTLSNSTNATPSEKYVTSLIPVVGYSAPAKSAVSVKIGSTAYTGFTYTQNSDATGTLTIPQGAVTGHVMITASGTKRSTYQVSIVPQNAEDGWYVTTERYVQGVLTTVHLNDGDNIYHGETLKYYAKAKPGYLTTQGKAVVSGDVVVSSDITVTLKFQSNANYTVSAHMTGLTFVGAASATHGTNYTATINPSGNMDLPDSVEVTIGGVSYTGFSWNAASGVLTIPGADIVGNIVVTAAAVSPKLAKPQNVSVSGKQLSFDAVSGAGTYDVLADGTSIGTVEA